mgnify:CR=1 FL=1
MSANLILENDHCTKFEKFYNNFNFHKNALLTTLKCESNFLHEDKAYRKYESGIEDWLELDESGRPYYKINCSYDASDSPKFRCILCIDLNNSYENIKSDIAGYIDKNSTYFCISGNQTNMSEIQDLLLMFKNIVKKYEDNVNEYFVVLDSINLALDSLCSFDASVLDLTNENNHRELYDFKGKCIQLNRINSISESGHYVLSVGK